MQEQGFAPSPGAFSGALGLHWGREKWVSREGPPSLQAQRERGLIPL